MNTLSHKIIDDDPWHEIKSFTEARISLGRCGTSLPLAESLNFKLAHAMARDAVLKPMDTAKVQNDLATIGLQTISLSSSAKDRSEYLTKPDRGRALSVESRNVLKKLGEPVDICVVVGDGLSSRAIHENCRPLLDTFFKMTKQAKLTFSPICFVKNARVAIADEIAPYFSAKVVVILIGERPGLSSPNSLGIYLTYNAKPGTTDEARNCISNIREGGLGVVDGANKLSYLIETALQKKMSGVNLKDKMSLDYLPFSVTLGHETITDGCI